ncbi:hypothetical protein AAC03nite_07900 [Alicyclobacillus acidoterrestris]|uniref:hypothetical protein n=1 Tax=Alicyclobacillus suci TaxID=2816080 RepID=UPI00118F45E5|nr:hypothetical protein [Alicyclobacillus suci]GEO25005.1 hypothetical protein AAC03nite_07900 [Alicyclobacillus acidoterrestris]
MLPLPLRFDGNEWFIILCTVFGFLCVSLLPKRYPRAVSTLVVLFVVSVAIVLDHSIMTPPLDMYDINDYKKYELMDVVTYFMYSPFALLSVYLYDKFHPKGFALVGYIIGWSALAEFFEWLATLFHVYTYTTWKLPYSFSVYLVATTLQMVFFRYTMKYYDRHNLKPETSPQ